MLIAALAFVLVPLLRTRDIRGKHHAQGSVMTDSASNVAIFRAQKGEIEQDFAGSLISQDERDQALKELSLRVAAEVKGDTASISAAPPVTNIVSKGVWVVAVIALMGFPLTAVLMYAKLGAPMVITGNAAARSVSAGNVASATTEGANPAASASTASGAAEPNPAVTDKQILAMVDSLAEKMRQNPGDPKGWVLLARSQNALGRFVEATQSYERAAALLPNDAQVLADYADATAMTQDGRFDGKPLALIKQALQVDPANMKALALAGTAEMRLGNKTQSLKHWEKLKSLVAKDSEDAREVDSIIAEVQGSAAGAPIAAPVTAVSNPNSAPNPQLNPQSNQASPSVAKAPGKMTSGMVSIAPELAAKITTGDTLFVFARAVNGPKMPLAVVKVAAPKSWPFQFALDDSMAMAPGMNLSAFPEVTIEARISKSGGAQPQAGDLAGQSATLKPGTSNIGVTISRVLP